MTINHPLGADGLAILALTARAPGRRAHVRANDTEPDALKPLVSKEWARVARALAASGAAPSAADIALDHVKQNKQQLGLSGSDVNEIAISDTVPSAHYGVTHVYLQQQHRGIDVYNGLINVNVARDGSVLSAGNRFVANLAAAAAGQNAKKTALDAAEAAAGHLDLTPSKAF